MSLSHENLIRLTTPDTTTKCFRSMFWCAILSRQRCVFWRDTISVSFSFSFDNYTKRIAIATKLDYYDKTFVYFQSIQRWFDLKPIKVSRRYFTLRMWEKLKKYVSIGISLSFSSIFQICQNLELWIDIDFYMFQFVFHWSYSVIFQVHFIYDSLLNYIIEKTYKEPRIMTNFLLLLSKYQIHMLPKKWKWYINFSFKTYRVRISMPQEKTYMNGKT